MRTKVKRKTYPVERSPLWQLHSQKSFAELLGMKKSNFRTLVTEREFHYRAWAGEASGKQRNFAVPVGPMRRLHERLKSLLDRFEKPAYLYSPRKGFSPRQNAVAHVQARELFKLDIKQFYPSTSREHIFRFCRYRLGMSDDVAGAFAKLATYQGFAPFGSPLSPILCFFAHQDVFDSIDRVSRVEGNAFSLWVDDMTISGDHISGELMYEVRRLIEAKGFRVHKDKWRHSSAGIVITGAWVSSGIIAPGNKHHVKMRDKLRAFDCTSAPLDRLKILNSLIGTNAVALAVYSAGTAAHQRAVRRQQ